MGTNYYVENQIGEEGEHVGKTVYIGMGQSQFLFAMSPDDFVKFVEKQVTFRDEYGYQFPSRRMLEIVLECDHLDRENIGRDFS